MDEKIRAILEDANPLSFRVLIYSRMCIWEISPKVSTLFSTMNARYWLRSRW